MTKTTESGALLADSALSQVGRWLAADYYCLAVLVFLSLAVHALHYVNTYTTARDSVGFAQLALQYESPKEAVVQYPCESVFDVMKRGEPPHPPVYPWVVLVVSKVVRFMSTDAVPDQMLRSTQIASMLGALLLVFPMYFLARKLFDLRTSFAVAALFQVLPVSARITSDGLTEAWYLLFLTISLCRGTQLLFNPNWRDAFFAGFWSGMAYLVRPEGIIALLACASALIFSAVILKNKRKMPLLLLLPIIVGFCLPALPYMALIGGLTLKPNGADMLAGVAFRPNVPSYPLLAANYSALEDGNKLAWTLLTLTKEMAKAFHYGPCFFAIVGLIHVVSRVARWPQFSVLLALFCGNIIVVLVFAHHAGYLSERHTLPIVMVGCFFAGHGMFLTADFFVTRTPKLTPLRSLTGWCYLLILIVSCVPALLRPMHENRYGHKLIGEYLQNHATPEDVVIDPYTWAQFYSGRSLRGVPKDPTPARYRWAIIEDGETPHSTLTRLEAAKKVQDDQVNVAETAYVWVDPSDQAKPRRILLLRQTVR